MGGAILVFKTRPASPPAYRRPKQSTPANGAADKTQKTPASNPATEPQKEDMIEDAIALGNSARDSNPPRYEDAERAYKLAAKLEPRDPRPYIGLGNILYDQKKFSEAAEAYQTALYLGVPRSSSMFGSFSRLNGVADRPAPYQVFINLSRKGELHAYLGTALLQSGEFRNAETELKQAIADQNEEAEARARSHLSYNKDASWHAMLGYSLSMQKRYAEAAAAYRTAVELDPGNADYKRLLEQSVRSQ